MTKRNASISFADLFDDKEELIGDRYFRKDLAPGAAEWTMNAAGQQVAGLMFVCPCGCGVVGHLTIRPCNERPSWEWDGNQEKPTLSPSIQKTTDCRWHGFLRAGVFEEC